MMRTTDRQTDRLTNGAGSTEVFCLGLINVWVYTQLELNEVHFNLEVFHVSSIFNHKPGEEKEMIYTHSNGRSRRNWMRRKKEKRE